MYFLKWLIVVLFVINISSYIVKIEWNFKISHSLVISHKIQHFETLYSGQDKVLVFGEIGLTFSV